MKRTLALIISLVLMLSAFTVCVSADGITAALTIKSLYENVIKDETFTVILYLDDNNYPVYSYQFGINYDNEYFEVTDITSDVKDGIDGIEIISNEEGKADFAYYTNGAVLSENDNDGVYKLASIEIKTLKNIDKDVTIELDSARTKFLNKEGTALEFNTTDLNIVIPAKPTKSSPTNNYFTSGETMKLTTSTKNADIYYTTSSDETPSTKMNGVIRLPNKNVTYYAVAKLYGISSDKASFSMSFRGSTGSSGSSGSSGGGMYTPTTSVNTGVTSGSDSNNADTEKYSDISSHWAKEYILKLSDKNIVNGYEDGTFKPANTVTRAEISKMIVCALGQDAATTVNLEFADNGEIPNWAAGYIQTAVNLGILNGYEDKTFRPTQAVTRKEMAKIAMAAFKYGEDKTFKLEFSDSAAIPDWAYGYIASAVKNNIITGYEDNTFVPDGYVTRAESCTILAKCIK